MASLTPNRTHLVQLFVRTPADFLNNVLQDLVLPFCLRCEGDENHRHYVLRLDDDSKELTVDDISEGERNLLALMYFFFSLYDDRNQEKLSKDVAAIVIDDPISSMDSQNRFYVLGLMARIFETSAKPGVQVFVFTHVWDDFCELSYGKEGDQDYRLLEIVKVSGQSQIVPCKFNNNPYKRLFREIVDFAEMEESAPGFDEAALHMPNTMSRVLEEYLAFNGLNGAPSSGKEQRIGELLFKDAWVKVGTSRKVRLDRLIKVTNLYSHRTSGPENYKEVHDCAKFMMNAIRDVTPNHYNAMLQG